MHLQRLQQRSAHIRTCNSAVELTVSPLTRMKLLADLIVCAVLVLATSGQCTKAATTAAQAITTPTTKTPMPTPPPKMGYSIVGAYADSTCSVPYVLSFRATPQASCQPSIVCTNRMAVTCATEYRGALAKAFGSKPYAVMVMYVDDQCTTAVGGSAFLVDGLCHPVGDDRFGKVSINSDKTVSLMIYKDATCSISNMNLQLSSDNIDQCTGKMTLSAVNIQLGKSIPPAYAVGSTFADDRCTSQPAMTFTLIGTGASCQRSSCNGRVTKQCTQDLFKIITSSQGQLKPYVQALQFSDSSCISLKGGSVVPVDGKCYSIDNKYTIATVNNDKTVTLTTFSDSACSKDAQVIALTSNNVGKCQSGSVMTIGNLQLGKGSYAAVKPNYELVGYYSDDSCKTPSSYAVTVVPKDQCQNTPCSGRQTMSCTEDLAQAVAKACGSKPYLQALRFRDDACQTMAGGVLVPLDNQCHAMDGQYYKATLDADKTVSAATFSNNKCTKDAQERLVASTNAGLCDHGWIMTVTNLVLGIGPSPK